MTRRTRPDVTIFLRLTTLLVFVEGRRYALVRLTDRVHLKPRTPSLKTEFRICVEYTSGEHLTLVYSMTSGECHESMRKYNVVSFWLDGNHSIFTHALLNPALQHIQALHFNYFLFVYGRIL